MNTKIKVLIVDDSALIRKLLSEILSKDPGLEVVGTASDPFVAREKIKQLKPDVLTLDVEMPKMDGLTFLGNLMRLRPMPVLMLSSLTEAGADTTLRALEMGAVDFISKPKIDLAYGLKELSVDIIDKVKTVAGARVKPLRPKARPVGSLGGRVIPPKLSADAVLAPGKGPKHFQTTDRLIAIGASTGGTEAIKEVLMDFPAASPIVVIAQHIPEMFSKSFANRLDQECAVHVSEAQDGQPLLPGHAYVAPGSHHLLVRRDGARYRAELSLKDPVNRHRPSVDVLFRSVAQNAGPNAVGAILTGMGADGAKGLGEMREAGAPTVAQDEATSVVWGMPGEAVKLDAANDVLPLPLIAKRLLYLASS